MTNVDNQQHIILNVTDLQSAECSSAGGPDGGAAV